MTLVLISIPLMVLAVAIAVLPVLLMSIREARHEQQSAATPSTARVVSQSPEAYSVAAGTGDAARVAA